MEVIEYRVKFRSRKDEFRIYPLGDIHLGTKHCNEKKIRSLVDEIKNDPHALWIGMGDYAELITPKDPRWDVDVIADWVERSNVAESQRKRALGLFSPIKDKCIGLLEGNHEVSIRLHNYQDIYLDLCRDLDVTPLGFSAFVYFKFHRGRNIHSFKGVFRHGAGAPQTEGGIIMNLKKLMDGFEADLYCQGHVHAIKTNTIPILTLNDALKIKARRRVGAISGSWFETYTQGVRASYAEIKGYSPNAIGCPHFVIVPDKERLSVVE